MKTYEEAIQEIKIDFLNYLSCRTDCKIKGVSKGIKEQASDHLEFWKTVYRSKVSTICFIYDIAIPNVVNDLWKALYSDCKCDLDRICVLANQFPTFAYTFQKELFKNKSMRVSGESEKVD